CTICWPFLIVNLNAIKSASYPTASPSVSGMNQAPFQSPVEADREVGQRRKMDSGSYVNDFGDNRLTADLVGHRSDIQGSLPCSATPGRKPSSSLILTIARS